MIAVVRSCTLLGIDAVGVDVECEVRSGQLPTYAVVGMPAPSVKEGAVRIRSALRTVKHDMPQKCVTVNLAPADLRKSGCALDLAIAIAIMVADRTYEETAVHGLLVLGELGLDGSLRPVRGVLASAMLARERGLRGILVPAACAAEAAVVDGLEIYAATHIAQVIDALAKRAPLPTLGDPSGAPRPPRAPRFDFAEVRGQMHARAAIEIAVAGGHNLMLSGPPGTGKTMLARRIPTVLPAMTRAEALETTKVYSALGLVDHGEQGLVEERPFRAPHHTISTAALIGGGVTPHPGEISLAHNGVLFLDELPEFSRSAIESLRQPLEDRVVTIGRVHGTIRLPASFLLVTASNPCPCGWAGSAMRECTCSSGALERYASRMSGPLLDRIDLQVVVEPVRFADLRRAQPSETSEQIRQRVMVARERQRARLDKYRVHCNAEMPLAVQRETCRLDADGEKTLADLVEKRRRMTARSIDRVIRVARTIADLIGLAEIDRDCLLEAAAYKPTDRTVEVLAA